MPEPVIGKSGETYTADQVHRCLVFHWKYSVNTLTGESELVVTNQRVVAKWGVLASTCELPVAETNVDVYQSTFVQKLLNYGTVFVHGNAGILGPFPNVAGPAQFKSAVDAQARLAR